MMGITLYQGDCLKILDNLIQNDIEIDTVITSPPYNFDMEYNLYQDNKPFNEYFGWLKEVFSRLYTLLKPSGRCIINIQPMFSEGIPTHHEICYIMKEIGFKWKAEILWEKNHFNCANSVFGSWKSPSSPYFKYTWEFIEIFYKDTYKKQGDPKNIDITADEFKQWVYAKWTFAPERDAQVLEHPAPFPVELPMRCLKLFTYKGDTVLDPFMGSGTTGVACKQTGRNFIGIEIDEKYFKNAKLRIERSGIQEELF